jgi:V/A-type H+-transporting ATPase subunit I
MNRIQIIGDRRDFDRAVDILYRTGTVHLEDVSEHVSGDELLLEKVRTSQAAEISALLEQVQVILATLPATAAGVTGQTRFAKQYAGESHEWITGRAKKMIADLETTAKDLAHRKNDLTQKIAALNRYAKILRIIEPIEHELPMLEGFELTILLIQKEYEQVLTLIREELTRLTKNQFEMNATPVDENTIAAIMIFNKKYSESVHSFIFSVNVNEVRLPPEYLGRPFHEMFTMIEKARLEASEELGHIDRTLITLSEEWFQELTVLRQYLENIQSEVSAYTKFGHSEFTFVIMGWIPKKFIRTTREALDKEFSGRVILHELKTTPDDMEHAPTFYDNPCFIKPFECIMRLVSPPRYMEVDPSPLLAIFFPIFFGIMVGDIGYGLMILIIAYILRKRYCAIEWFRQLMNVMIISSIPAIFFGFLFGEFFGNFGEMMGWLEPMHLFGVTWNRIDAIIPMLLLTIAIGIIHVFLGFIIGFVNEYARKSRKHAMEKAGMLLVLTGLVILIAMTFKMLPDYSMYPAIFLILIAIPVILYTAGAFGTLEIMSAVGNILSYTRLMAIGMASVILAFVANELGGTFEVVLVGIIIAVLLHALNIVLAMFSPSIHSIRLHLVEFYSKFYKGGGIEYRPFRRTENRETQGNEKQSGMIS